MKLLILGSSFKRCQDKEMMAAINRYDGVFFQVARKNLKNNDAGILILTEDLELIDANCEIPYKSPMGRDWKIKNQYSEAYIEKMKRKNELFLQNKLGQNKVDDLFIAVGAPFRKAIAIPLSFKGKVTLPDSGGLGPTAKLLKNWLLS